MLILYNFLFVLFAIVYLPSFFLKGKHTKDFSGRFGRVPREVAGRFSGKEVWWVHAVSVGEVALALRLFEEWRTRFPGKTYVLTVTTAAGREIAERQKPPGATVLWFPVDFPFAVKRFLDSVNPRLAVVLETEIWPNLLTELSRRKTPCYLLNGRLSDRAFPKYRRVRFFLKPFIRLFSGIGAQDEKMKARFLELGADPDRLHVTGNMKFDWKPAEAHSPEAEALRRELETGQKRLFLAVSTHAGEEEILFDLQKKIHQRYPEVLLAVAPRHLDRISAIEALAEKTATPLKKVFSTENNRYDDGGSGIRLIDRMGALPPFYEMAELVFVGGSLVPIGGHNPVEPAYFSRPIIVGPNTQNFDEITRVFLEAGALRQAESTLVFETAVLSLLGNESERMRMGASAKQLVDRLGGAAKRNTDVFLTDRRT